ncbi:MAG: putative mRNA 3-end processing factor [Archaeoglobi archaeon]|nr:putative mRNA 3-end processing factor [Archaeoglobi archaeon]MDK2781800.1 putative mRNA 3-end processing factor [Archaeoglobi archaeon]
MRNLIDLGVLPVRISSGRYLRPHLSLIFRFENRRYTIGVDTTEGRKPVNDLLLITHAHSDHHGQRVMGFQHSVASHQTARALEIISKKPFRGTRFELGEEIKMNGLRLKTFETHHTPGSSAFFFKNDLGTRILVTGDVKDFRSLPECDVLITEATYGDPDDPSCFFEDDIESFLRSAEESSAFGAYPFGKAQRAVRILRENGFHDEIQMDALPLLLTRELLGDENLSEIKDGESLRIVSPRTLRSLNCRNKFVLSAQRFHSPRITLSDHASFRELIEMIHHCNPEAVILYHGGSRAVKMREHLRKLGYCAFSLKDIEMILGDPDGLSEKLSGDF